jgi:serine O-acetyltransferase
MQGKRHPTLGNNVMVGSGAKVLGPIKIGDNARVAANSVVLREVPANSTVVGVPGRVVRINGEKTDHIHTPDPVALELQSLRERIEQLENQLKNKE